MCVRRRVYSGAFRLWHRGLSAFLAAALGAVLCTSSLRPLAASSPTVVWVGDHKVLRGVDTERDQFLQTVSLDRAANAAAVDRDNTVWLLQGRQLVQYDQAGQIRRRLDLSLIAPNLHTPKVAVLDPYDASFWVVAPGSLLHASAAGDKLLEWTAPATVQAFDLDIDQSVWVLTKKQLLHLSVTGAVIGAVELRDVLDEPTQLAIDSLGGLVWVASKRRLLQFDLNNLSQPPRAIDVTATPDEPADGTITEEDEDRPPRIKTLNVHPLAGTVWLVSRHTLYLFNRQGALLRSVDLLPFQLGKIKSIAYDPITPALWLGGKDALGHFTTGGDFIARLPVDKTAAVIGVAPFTLLPTLSLVSPAENSLTSDPRPTFRFGLGASCTGTPCLLPDAYIRSLVLDVDINSQAVGPLFNIEGVEAMFTPASRLPDGLNLFRANAKDLFGHGSANLSGRFTIDTLAPKFLSVTPASGSTFSTASVTIQGALDDPTANVLLLDGAGQGISMTSGAAFSFAVTLNPGVNTFTLVAQDPVGNATSLALTLNLSTVNVLVTSIVSGATVGTDSLGVSGDLDGPDNTGVTVNGVVAMVVNGKFYVNNLSLQPGSNTITVIATTPDGQTVTKSITVTSAGRSSVQATATPQSGVAPLNVAFTVSNQTSSTISRIAVDFDGNGSTDLTTTDLAVPIAFSYTAPGIYQPRITVTDTQGIATTENLTIVVYDAAQMDRLFSSVWNRMNSALTAGNIVGASKYLNASAQRNYQPVFEALKPHMTEIFNSFSPLQRVSISQDIGEYAVVRRFNDQNRLYLIYFIRDADGVWRVDGM